MKTIKPYNGADVTFDFSGQGNADSSLAIRTRRQ